MKNFYWGRRALSKKYNFTKLVNPNYSRMKSVLVSPFIMFLLFSHTVLAQSTKMWSAAGTVLPIKSLTIGEKVPAEFWEMKHLFYDNGEIRELTLSEFKGKLLIFDFWSTTCTICLKHQEEISHFKEKYKDQLAIVMVNPLNSYDNLSILQKKIREPFFKSFGITEANFTTIVEDEYLQALFPSKGYPQYVWINSAGYVQLITFRNLLDRNYSLPYID